MPRRKTAAPDLYAAAAFFGLLSDPTRLRILMHLAENDRASVDELRRLAGVSQSVASNALTKLRLSRLVSFRREGQRSLYRLDSPLVRELLRWFQDRGARERERGNPCD